MVCGEKALSHATGQPFSPGGGGQTAEFPWAHPGLLLNLHSALRGDKDWHPGLEVGELEPGKDLARLTQLVNGQSSSLTHN